MTTSHHGSCQCGAIEFRLDGVFERFFLCHCAHCRKDTGSAHAANLFSSRGTLEWLAGQDLLRSFTLAQTRHTRCFCSVCGSAMPHVAQDFIVVPAGSLDSVLDDTPTAHIFMASRAAWDGNETEVPLFDAYPS